MTTIKVKIFAKEREPYLNYHTSSFEVGNVNFPIQIYAEEVMSLPSKKRKEYARILKTFISTTASFLMLSSRSMASTLTSAKPSVPTTGLPPDLIEPIMELIRWALGGSVLLAVLLLIAAGALRMFRKKKEAADWTTDIIRGFIQILLATPVIFLMYYIVTLLLGNFSNFLNPFAMQ